MRRVLFITPRDLEFGFALTGVDHRMASTGEAAEALSRVRGESEIGLVAIDERLIAGIPDELFREIENKWDGVVVVLPAPELPGTKVEDYAMELIRKTIGYHLRLTP